MVQNILTQIEFTPIQGTLQLFGNLDELAQCRKFGNKELIRKQNCRATTNKRRRLVGCATLVQIRSGSFVGLLLIRKTESSGATVLPP